MIDKHDRNDLANSGVVVGFDSRYDSFGYAHISAAAFKAFGIRVYMFDRYAIAPIVAYFTKKFHCLLGIFFNGGSMPAEYNGIELFTQQGGSLSDKATLEQLDRCMQTCCSDHLLDLSPLFDYTSKKIKFKADNFTDAAIKSYI